MTLAVPGTTPLSLSSRAPSIVVVGADTILGALPATPVQLAHACMHVGFHHVVPASWGDELIASASLRVMQQRGKTPAVQCSCPLVAHRLLSVGTDLRPFLISLVSPPVALARYLRALYGGAQLHITYVGRCPGAKDESIDARMTPEDLFALFSDQNIVIEDQPPVFDSVIPPDRRRFQSQPSGVPTVDALWSSGGGRSLVELVGEELSIELAQLLLSGAPVLVDAGPALGCVCAGRTADYEVEEGRAILASLEPPRAATPVIDTRIAVALEVPLQSPPSSNSAPATPSPSGGGSGTGSVVAPRGGGTPFVRQVVMPPPSLPFYSELEPPHDRVPVAPTLPVSREAAVPVGVEAVEEASAFEELELTAAALNDEGLESFEVSAASPMHEQTVESVAVNADMHVPEEDMSEPSHIPQNVATYKPPRRRTPVHGVARIAQGDVPMARSSDGRPLPRAYASHRRQSYLGLRVADVADISSEVSREDAAPAPVPDDGSQSTSRSTPIEVPADVPVVDDRATVIVPTIAETTKSPTSADGSAHADGADIASSIIGASVDAPAVAAEASPAHTSESRHVDVPRLQETERPVQLPLERLSDRPSGAAKRHARVTPAHLDTDRPAQTTPRRSWTIFLIAIALVALLSSAAGVAIGAWYMTHRPAPTGRP